MKSTGFQSIIPDSGAARLIRDPEQKAARVAAWLAALP